MQRKLAVITGYAKDPEFVKTLLRHLDCQTLKMFDCYVYASPSCNYFLDDELLKKLTFPCRHLRLEENRGFAGNNNLSITAALSAHDYDGVVLINDDTIPVENLLEELYQTANTDDRIGAVAPKMLFYEKFVTLRGELAPHHDNRAKTAGIRFYTNTGFAGTFYPKRFYTEGFANPEEDHIYTYRRTAKQFNVEIPYREQGNGDYQLKLFVSKQQKDPQVLTLSIGSEHVADITLEDNRSFYEIQIPAALIERHGHYIIQNAGSEITRDRTYEVGFGEQDNDQYNVMREPGLFCGGACYLRKSALQESGLFMDGLFSYYEDSDLSMRLKRNGYRIVYNPKAVVRHYHTGTSKEWSPMFTYYAFRNKIIFAAKTFGMSAFIKAFAERFRETFVYMKLFLRSRGRNHNYRSRIKLNLVILKDALIGIVKFKPKFLPK